MQKCISALKIGVAYFVSISSALGRSFLFDIIDQIPEVIYSEKNVDMDIYRFIQIVRYD